MTRQAIHRAGWFLHVEPDPDGTLALRHFRLVVERYVPQAGQEKQPMRRTIQEQLAALAAMERQPGQEG